MQQLFMQLQSTFTHWELKQVRVSKGKASRTLSMTAGAELNFCRHRSLNAQANTCCYSDIQDFQFLQNVVLGFVNERSGIPS